MTINDGGPAFPVPGMQNDGMSMRDHFAGLAMLAELQSAGSYKGPADALRQAAQRAGRTVEQQVAWNAYQAADAMLAERRKVSA